MGIATGSTELASSLNPDNFGLQIIATSLDGIGLPALLNTTLVFLDIVSVHWFIDSVTSQRLCLMLSGQHTLDQYLVFKYGTRIIHLVSSLSVILFVVGGLALGAAVDQTHLILGDTIRRAGYIIICIMYAAVVGVAVHCLCKRDQVLKYRREVRSKLQGFIFRSTDL